LINAGFILEAILFRTVPERNLCSDVKAKTFLRKRFEKHITSTRKTNKNETKLFLYDSLESWSLHDTVRRFEDVLAVLSYQTRMIMI